MSGRDVKPRLPRMPGQGRPRASLVAAAAASQPDTPAGDVMDVDAAAPAAGPSSLPMAHSRSGTASERSASAALTPGNASSGDTSAPPSAAATKMKFKPKMPIRRAAQVEPEIKAEPSAVGAGAGAAGRGGAAARGARGRGRGGARGGRGGAAVGTIAAGPFGGSRPTTSRRLAVPPPPPRTWGPEMTSMEVYSDNEDGERGEGGGAVIDIEAVSALSESAPTSLYRDRDLDGGKAKAKAADKAKLKDAKARRKAEREARAAQLATRNAAAAAAASGEVVGINIKDEPISPVRANAPLPTVVGREADSMIPADEQQDRDASGRRVRAFAASGGLDSESPDRTLSTTGTPDTEINEAQRVDLSESESEEEEEDMEGDFVFVPGMDNPEDKLFTFQFPPQFPKFVSRAPVDATTEGPDGDKDAKPTPAAMAKAKRKAATAPPPEGRIGTLVVMKSGKVKMVFGEGDDGIVMNVTPGVPSTFLQQVVHLDARAKSTTVLGEVHKQYVVTPDIDRLLEELFINGGETPGDREKRDRDRERRVKMERGLVKMEPSSP